MIACPLKLLRQIDEWLRVYSVTACQLLNKTLFSYRTFHIITSDECRRNLSLDLIKCLFRGRRVFRPLPTERSRKLLVLLFLFSCVSG